MRPTTNGETVQTMYGESFQNSQVAEIGLGLGVHPTAASRGLLASEPTSIEYNECGSGPAVVLVPGSCSTGAAWRSVVSHLGDGFRCVTTSLLGYGETDEGRTMADASIDHECHVVEQVIERAGGRVHLVGHSFGGLVALAVALRGHAPLASLTILEAPAVGFLRDEGDEESLSRLPQSHRRLLPRVSEWQPRSDRSHDRFLWRPRHIRFVAPAGSVACRRND